MAELPKEDLMRIAQANQRLVDVAKNLAPAAQTNDEMVCSQILTQIDTVLNIVE